MSDAPENSDQDARSPQTGPAMPLALSSQGQEVVLVSVRGGRRLQHRLAEMGLAPGSTFTVITKGRPGPFIVSVKDTRMMLGHGMVNRVFVRPV